MKGQNTEIVVTDRRGSNWVGWMKARTPKLMVTGMARTGWDQCKSVSEVVTTDMAQKDLSMRRKARQ